MPEEVTDTPQPEVSQEQLIQTQLRARIERNFTYHAPKGSQVDIYSELRQRGLALALYIADVLPNCREQAVAITKLEEVIMWANAGIAREGAHSGEG